MCRIRLPATKPKTRTSASSFFPRDAYERGFRQVLVEDAMACMTAEGHEHAVKRVFPRLGLVRPTAEVLAALK